MCDKHVSIEDKTRWEINGGVSAKIRIGSMEFEYAAEVDYLRCSAEILKLQRIYNEEVRRRTQETMLAIEKDLKLFIWP